MQAEVPQPISNVPSRWGGLTTAQLGWLAVASGVPMLLLRAHAGMPGVLAASAPWGSVCVALGFGLRRGRRLDAYLVDAVRFRAQPRRLRHPDICSRAPDFRPVDRPPDRPLRWSSPSGAAAGR